jgi:hypothetical protein
VKTSQSQPNSPVRAQSGPRRCAAKPRPTGSARDAKISSESCYPARDEMQAEVQRSRAGQQASSSVSRFLFSLSVFSIFLGRNVSYVATDAVVAPMQRNLRMVAGCQSRVWQVQINPLRCRLLDFRFSGPAVPSCRTDAVCSTVMQGPRQRYALNTCMET